MYPGQLAAVFAVGIRQLLWGLRGVSVEVARWRMRAAGIPDLTLRTDALGSIERKRGNIDGAALFSILPSRRSPQLLRALVAFEILADFLDCATERGAGAGIANGLLLHRALIDALEPELETSDYYRLHPWKDDGGYLLALVGTCRESCGELPSFQLARPLILQGTCAAQVLALNHESDELARDALLRSWAERSASVDRSLAWFELSAGASAWLTVLAMLALAAEPELEEGYLLATNAVYGPWISLAGTMLDSYVDQDEDAANGDHSYIGHYDSTHVALERLGELIRQAVGEARRLPRGNRHAVLAASMVAMYLSKDSARLPERRASTATLARAGGSLTRLLLPILRLWRIAYGLRSA